MGDEVKAARWVLGAAAVAALGAGVWWFAARRVAADGPPILPPGSLSDEPLEARISEFADAIRRAPGDAVAWSRLAMTYHVQEIYPEAVTCYDRAVALQDDNPRWWWFRAACLESLDRFDEAVASAQRAIELAPEYAPARAMLAKWYVGRGLLDEGLRCAIESTEADASDSGAWTVLAMVRLERGEWAEGEAAARRALRLPFFRGSQRSYAHYVLGRCLQGLGRLDEAKIEIARGRDGDGRFPVTDTWQRDLTEFQFGFRLLLATCHGEMRAGNYERVLPFLLDLRRREPDHLQVLTDLGLVLRQIGRPAESAEVLEHAVKVHPTQPGVRVQYALTLEAMGNLDGAMAQFEAGIRDNPNAGEIFENRGMVHMRKSRWAEAVADFDRSFEVEPDRSWVLVHAGVALLESADTDGAEKEFLRCRSADPGNADLYAGLAVVAARRGDLAEADRHLATARGLAPAGTILQGAAEDELDRARALRK